MENAEGKNALCSICQTPATQMVDGEPACSEHIELVYENQVEDYTKAHQRDNEWLHN